MKRGLLLLAVVVAGFGISTAARMPCRTVCGSDIGRLYQERGIDRAHAPYFDRDLEYPPVIGLVMYGATVVSNAGARVRFVLNALVLLGLALATTWLLWRRFGTRTWRWALSPPLLLEGLTNWDLLAVGPATIGLLQWETGNAIGAGVLLGVGAAAKLVPALYVAMLAASCRPRRAWRRARSVVIGACIGAGAFVIPVYGFAPHALSHFLSFERARGPSRATIWLYLFRNASMKQWLAQPHVIHFVNIASPLVLACTLAAIIAATARGRITAISACALATIAFIVTSKIYSPQYDLWLVPFFVLSPVRTKLVVHFYSAGLCVFVLTAIENHAIHRPLSLYLLGAAAAYRLAVQALLARDFVRVGMPSRICRISQPYSEGPCRRPSTRS